MEECQKCRLAFPITSCNSCGCSRVFLCRVIDDRNGKRCDQCACAIFSFSKPWGTKLICRICRKK